MEGNYKIKLGENTTIFAKSLNTTIKNEINEASKSGVRISLTYSC